MNKIHALQNLLNNSASEEDIALLKRLLASGEISIGGNVNQSVIIIGSGNTVELPPAALDRLNARPMLGNLDRDLTNEEIASGLRRLDKLLPNRAPVLLPHYKEQVGRLRPTLKTEIKALSETSRRERLEALAAINSICVEVVDVSFNGLSLGEEAPKYDARSPFRGLESFRPEDSEFFFGREALTKKLVAKIQSHPFLAVLGASGSGKSSLVMAGLIPALDLDYIIFRPGTNPLDELESARGKSLIVVDQFEELFTLTRDESTRKDFIARLLDESSRTRIILTLRSDFLGEVGAYRTLSAEIQNHLEIIPPMDMDELRRAMEGQAGMVGLRFEADLSQQILDDVEGEPGAMPLLQHALWELWNRRHGRNLRASEYRAFGGVKQAIASAAENVYADCSKPEQDQLRDIFLRLTRLDDSDEGRDTRRRVPLGDLIPSGRDAAFITLLLDKLANARLIVKTVNEDKTEVEVAHEALIRHWERLRLWLNEDRDALRLREGIIDAARQWETSKRDESLLIHRAGRLDDAVSLNKDLHYGLTDIEQSYLKECVVYQTREQNRRERLRRQITTGLGIGFAVVLAIATLAVLQWQKAEQQARIAFVRQLLSQGQSANTQGNTKQIVSILLIIQSMKTLPLLETTQILQNSPLTRQVSYMTHGDVVYSVAFSPNGKYVLSSSKDGLTRVWDIASGQEISRMNHDNFSETLDNKLMIRNLVDLTSGLLNQLRFKPITFNLAVFSPDGNYVVSGNGDNTVRVWNATTGKEIARMIHSDLISSIAFSLNGKYVVSGSWDGTARVWEAMTGREVSRMTHDGPISSVAFSQDSLFVVSGSEDHIARVWKTETGEEIARMTHDGPVYSVAFSRDGKFVISGSQDSTARVWETETGEEIGRMTHDGPVYFVAFSQDNKFVVSGSEDGVARVWKPESSKEIAQMTHGSPVYSVAFSPDGKYVVSSSRDGLALVWDTITGKEVAHTILESITSLSFSPNGKYIVSGSGNTARVWEAITSVEVTLSNQKDAIYTVAFNPDGKYVATGSKDRTVCIWDPVTGKEMVRMIHDGSVYSIAFSLDGRHVVSGSEDHTIRVWDTVTGKEIARMTHAGIVYTVAISPDGRYVVSGSADNTARVWDTINGNEISRMTHDGNVYSVAFSPNGKYVASGSEDGTVRIWETTSGKEITRKTEQDVPAYSVAFSPNSKYVVGSWRGTFLAWDASTGKEVSRTPPHENLGLDLRGGLLALLCKDNPTECTDNFDMIYFSPVAFSPNGKYIMSGTDNGPQIIKDTYNGQEISLIPYDDRNDSTGAIAFSPDGEYAVSGGRNGIVRVWESTTGKEIVVFLRHDGEVYSVAFSPDGKYIVSGSADGTAKIWLYRPGDLIAEACSRVTRNLTRAEWNQYIGDALPYQAVCPNLPIEPEAAGTSTP